MIDRLLDHVVIATSGLEATVAALTRTLGVAPAEGGSHLGRGTRNYLLGLGQRSYLEIIARDDDQAEPEEPRMFGLDHLDVFSRLVTWAVAPTAFDDTMAHAEAANLDLGHVTELRRAGASGDIRVRITERPSAASDGVLPFLVDWGDGRNPAGSLPSVALRELRGTHPQPQAVRSGLEVLGAHLDLEWGVTPSVEMVLEGPNGIIRIK